MAGQPPAPGPPPGCIIDLGNGEAIVFGTADDHLAAAEYLARHYPDPAR